MPSEAVEAQGERWCVEAGCVDDDARAQGHRFRATDREDMAYAINTQAIDRRAQHDRAAGALKIALQCEHQAMAVDDAARRREQCGVAAQRWLQCACLIGTQQLQIEHAVGRAALRKLSEPLDLRRRRRHDELAAAPLRDAMRLAERVELDRGPARKAGP